MFQHCFDFVLPLLFHKCVADAARCGRVKELGEAVDEKLETDI